MTVQRKVTVQVDLKATGDLGRTLEVNKRQAQELARATATRAGVAPGRTILPAEVAAIRSPPRLTSAPGFGPAGGLAGGGEGSFSLGPMLGMVGKVTLGFGLALGAVNMLRSAFDTLGDRTVRAADALSRMQSFAADVQTAVQGDRLTREQYERGLRAGQRLAIESAPEGQRAGVLQGLMANFQNVLRMTGSQQQISRAGAASQEALERLRNIPFGANGMLEEGPGGGAAAREMRRRMEINNALVQTGLTQAQVANRMQALRESGIDLGARTLDDATIRQVTQIVSGTAQAQAAVAGINAITQIQAQGVPPVIAGTTAEEQARMRPVQVGFFESGQFYDRMTQAMHQPEQADTQRRIANLLDALNGTLSTLNQRLPPPPGPASNDAAAV